MVILRQILVQAEMVKLGKWTGSKGLSKVAVRWAVLADGRASDQLRVEPRQVAEVVILLDVWVIIIYVHWSLTYLNTINWINTDGWPVHETWAHPVIALVYLILTDVRLHTRLIKLFWDRLRGVYVKLLIFIVIELMPLVFRFWNYDWGRYRLLVF